MNNFNTILQLPERCLLNKKITKAFFKRNFALTSKEKALLDDADAIVFIDWLASLSPQSVNINPYENEYFLYEEVQVISAYSKAINIEKLYFKIIELIQKYIPYPILLIVYTDDIFVMNTSDKKINQNDNSLRTIDRQYISEMMRFNELTTAHQLFLDSLPFAELDKTNLKTFYDAYTQRIAALKTIAITGSFIPRTQSRTATDVENLQKIEMLEKEITALQNEAKKETQLNQQINLNMKIQLKRKTIMELKALIAAE